MISDICSDASDQIQEWQRDCPKWYAELAVEIGNVRLVLDSLRLYLDMQPPGERPPGADPSSPLRRALAELDVSALAAAHAAIIIRQPTNTAPAA
jgi:hypothetical protein